MRRKLLEKLMEWAKRPGRKPLVLQGARQVGKTYTLLEFGQSDFEGVAYVNLESDALAREAFAGDLTPREVLARLAPLLSRPVTPQTLLFLDEIQSCKRALAALKYFCERMPEQPVAVAGSLLGVAVRGDDVGFPVGKVDFLTMHPMDFEEFAWACGQGALTDAVREGFARDVRVSSVEHELLARLYREYLVVGGMPEVVACHAATRGASGWEEVRLAQNRLRQSMAADMARYATPTETRRILACYESLPRQLAKPNLKFQYRVVRMGATASRYGYALDWLSQAGLVAQCHAVSSVERPLPTFEDPSAFKAFLMDVGLYGAMAGFRPEEIVAAHPGTAFGGLAETYVAQALAANDIKPYYWASGSGAEVDFVYDGAAAPVAVEVKRGEHVRSRSLAALLARAPAVRAVRLSEREFGRTDRLLSLPLYAAFLLT